MLHRPRAVVTSRRLRLLPDPRGGGQRPAAKGHESARRQSVQVLLVLRETLLRAYRSMTSSLLGADEGTPRGDAPTLTAACRMPDHPRTTNRTTPSGTTKLRTPTGEPRAALSMRTAPGVVLREFSSSKKARGEAADVRRQQGDPRSGFKRCGTEGGRSNRVIHRRISSCPGRAS